jgi:hypothetical protein
MEERGSPLLALLHKETGIELILTERNFSLMCLAQGQALYGDFSPLILIRS